METMRDIDGGIMRTFIRHPSDIPIEIEPEQADSAQNEYMTNVGMGGVCFKSSQPLEEETIIRIRIPLVRPIFEAKGKVAWCRKEDAHYDIGVEFVETQDAFKARMVEQICHIEHYKREIHEKEGRSLSGQEAALEWISKYANTFEPEVTQK
jgi:hypothetical protein